jgi:hypothetical protein
MEAGGIPSHQGILLLKELLEITIGFVHETRPKVDFEGKAHDLCRRLHQHLLVQASIPGNKALCDYLDVDGRTVNERLERQRIDLEKIVSGDEHSIMALDRIRAAINHSDGMKQLLVGGGPFTNEISDTAKIAGFALKLLSASAYANPDLHDEREGIMLLGHVAEAIRKHKLEWVGSPPEG